MTDVHSKEQRSYNMSRIKNKDTKPELLIRKALFSEGFRYRLHRKDLPGKPDMVFPKYRAVIFVNGCFFHYHDCRLFKMPQTRRSWWKKKLTGNRIRDQKNITALLNSGWRVLTIWECSWRGKGSIADSIRIISRKAANWLCSESRMKTVKG
ncbi:MAG: very short patch repair endonuclease [Deltaproteobacteria bacterium]|nr:MAG: very short patch repair endonuclease [Deltaproteobacteria bacterium]